MLTLSIFPEMKAAFILDSTLPILTKVSSSNYLYLVKVKSLKAFLYKSEKAQVIISHATKPFKAAISNSIIIIASLYDSVVEICGCRITSPAAQLSNYPLPRHF